METITWGLQRIGINDNFFELGGHSLLATQLVSRMKKEGIIIPLKIIFELPTIKDITKFIVNNDDNNNYYPNIKNNVKINDSGDAAIILILIMLIVFIIIIVIILTLIFLMIVIKKKKKKKNIYINVKTKNKFTITNFSC